MAGPRLTRLSLWEPFVPLLHLLPRLIRVDIFEHRSTAFPREDNQHINVLVLTALPALRNLGVHANPSCTACVRHLEEVTQLDTLRLFNTLPESGVVPAGLSSIHLLVEASYNQPHLDCLPVFQNLSTRLGLLHLAGYFQQFGYDVSRLSSMTFLQQLTYLGLLFKRYPVPSVFEFPLLKHLALELWWPAGQCPVWDLSGCQLELAELTLILDGKTVADLSRVKDLHAERLQIHLELRNDHARLSRVQMASSSWKVKAVDITFQSSTGLAWRACHCVKDCLAGVLGVVPFSHVRVDGHPASTLTGCW